MMKKIVVFLVCLFSASLTPIYAQDLVVGPGVKVKTPDGTVNRKAGTIVFPDGTITFYGNVATLDLSSLGGGDMSTTTWTSGGYLATAKGGLGVDVSSAGVDATEFGYLNGVTSAIQTQLNAKQAASANLTTAAGITGNSKFFGTNGSGVVGIYDIPAGTWAGLTGGTSTADFVVGTGGSITYEDTGTINANQFAGVTTVDATEFGYLNGVTGAIQSQIDGKAASSHAHAGSAITSGTVAATYLPSNAADSAGIVATGSGQVNKVWKTDADGIPSWRDDSTGGTPTFDTVGSGTNTTSTMTVGAGGTLTYSTTGIVNASRFQGVTSVDATEFGYLDGVTSALQTQLNAKAPLVSPSFTTPTLGVATATSVNKLTLTAPATGATLTLADGGTLATSGAYSTTLTASNTTNVTLPTSGTLYGTATGSITSANLIGSLSDETGTGVAVFGTSPSFTTSILPATAGGAAIGSTTYEWGNVYLTDGAIIYGQANQGNTLTSAATGWTANLEFSARSFVPTAAANANGEFGYATNAFSWQADSETLTATASTSGNTWTFASGTGATFAFTPSVVFTGGIGSTLSPASSDGAALGTTSLMWSDLFLASGGVINWSNGDVTATHSANTLAFAGASSGYTFDAAMTVTGAALPGTANTYALGSATNEWSDLFLGDGAVIYGQNDQSATLTSSAGKWTANVLDVTGAMTSGTISAGAGGFSVDADGDATAKTLTITGATGTAGYARVLEDPAYGTNYRGWSMASATDYTTSWTVNWPGGDPTANQFLLLGVPSGGVVTSTFGSFGSEFTVAANTVSLASDSIALSKLDTSGTPSGSTALYGDGAWKAVTAAASGSDGYVQFASSSALSSDAGLAFNSTTQRLTVGKSGTTGGLTLLAETGATDYTTTLLPSASAAANLSTTLWASALVAGDTVIASGNNQLGVVAKGTAYQIFGMNSGATAPAWTSTLGATGTRLTAGYFTDLAVTNAITGSVTGNAGTVTVADAADDTTTWPMLAPGATGSLAPATDSSLTYNASTGALGASSFVPSTAADVAGEFGYASNAFSWFANSEDFTATASSNLWTFASGTSATFAYTPSVAFNAGLTVPTGQSVALAGTAYVALGADPGDSGAVRLSNNTAISWEQSTPGTDIFIALDGSDILQVGQNAAAIYLGTSGTGNVTVTGDLTVTGSDLMLGTDGSGGVKLSTDGDGALVILGAGGGNDESITINLDDTENAAVVSSGSGVTKMDFSALNMVTTGYIQGGINISSDADGMDATAMTAAGMYGTMFIATGAGTWTLPSAAVGMSACLMDSGTAHDLILDVTAGDTMRLKGTEGSDGVGITNASGTSTGDFVCVVAVAANKWSTVGMQGTWASQ